MLLAHKGSKSRFLMQMVTCNILVVSAIWKVAYFGRICDDWSLCWRIREIWSTLLSRKFTNNVPHASHFIHVHAPFNYKGCLSSKTIIFFVLTTNLTKDTNYFAGIHECIVLFSWFVSFVSFVVQQQSLSFVLTTNWTNKTNSIVGVNERRRSPNQTNLAKSRDMLTLSDLFHSQNACVHCLV